MQSFEIERVVQDGIVKIKMTVNGVEYVADRTDALSIAEGIMRLMY